MRVNRAYDDLPELAELTKDRLISFKVIKKLEFMAGT
jgi:hypothetical protein